MSAVCTRVDLIRHGEPVGGRKYRGQSDDPLSERGWAQMRAAVAEHGPWSAVVTSPLSRCRAFAEEVAQARGLPLQVEARFKEIGFGTWEGRTADSLNALEPGVVERFWRDPEALTPPGAEPVAAFRDRVVAGWDTLLAAHHGAHVLVVAHAGTIRMVVRHVLEMPLRHTFRIQVENAGLTRVEVLGEGPDAFPRLVFHGGRL